MRNSWRIYRLPGSRDIWHIDSGVGTDVFNVRGYKCLVPSQSVDIGGNHVPRAWIAVSRCFFLHLVDGVALFMGREIPPPVCKCASNIEVITETDATKI